MAEAGVARRDETLGPTLTLYRPISRPDPDPKPNAMPLLIVARRDCALEERPHTTCTCMCMCMDMCMHMHMHMHMHMCM